MSRDFNPVGIQISAGLGKCANHCRHCQLSYKKPANFSVDRYVTVVDKFIDYREKTGFEVNQWLGYSFNLSANYFSKLIELHHRLGGFELKVLLLGGLPFMNSDQFTDWFLQRKEMGSESVVASFYGPETLHDYLNNKKGHFDWQISTQKTAAKNGLNNWQRVFLLKSALPHMDHILDRLDETENVTSRVAYLLFYSGLGRRFEDERLTMDILDRQSQRLQAIYREDKNRWLSERDWLEFERNNPDSGSDGELSLILTDKNIEWVEKLSCEEIVEDLTVRTKAAYRSVPSRAELAEKYGDRFNEKVYMFMWEMECLWMDRFLKANPDFQFERLLTHFGR
jgi:MoaA/NifB/PqqE/SkfB family radical SAM enzyme